MHFASKQIDLLRQICSVIQKKDITNVLKRVQTGNVNEVLSYFHEGPPLQIEKDMKELDTVDKNILRELAIRTIDMVQERARDKFKAGAHGSDSGTEGTAQRVDHGEAFQTTVAEGS